MTNEQRAKEIADRILAHCTQVLAVRSVTVQQARDIADDLQARARSIDGGLRETQKRGVKAPIDYKAPSMMIELPPVFSDAIPPLDVLRAIIERQLVHEFLANGTDG